MNRGEKLGPHTVLHPPAHWEAPASKPPVDPDAVYIVGEIDTRRTMAFRGSIVDLTKLRDALTRAIESGQPATCEDVLGCSVIRIELA